jgi:hypothetical protein
MEMGERASIGSEQIALWRFDFDDIRTQIGENLSAPRGRISPSLYDQLFVMPSVSLQRNVEFRRHPQHQFRIGNGGDNA